MSSSDSCIVSYSYGVLAGNGELERLLDELLHWPSTDHCRAEVHPRQNVLDGLREELVCRLEHLELAHVRSSVSIHHELCLNLTRDAGALQNRRIFRFGTVR